MNIYIVNPEHINVMLWAGMKIGIHRGRPIEWRAFPGDSRSLIRNILELPVVNDVGQMLCDANRRAAAAPEPYAYAYQAPARDDWSLLDVLAAIEGYECHNVRGREWRPSEAQAFCRALEHAVVHELVRELPHAGRTGTYHITCESAPSGAEASASFPVPADDIAVFRYAATQPDSL